ncbi:endonuclease [Oceanobacillus halophilus]|uniref:Endonuclease n=1 Tax=Oceanobacillus halophilus TaxID=930130 RepID=A0A495A3Z6_9BACI|nr:endonuclease [Oceanobacillus halophilus]RKQ34247.1 endonuclease [Oceanobacillus halophilus]
MEKNWLNTSASFKAKVIGKLLGDGCITMQEGRKPRFQFTHVSRDYSWSNYCYLQLLEFLPLSPPKYKKNIDHRLQQGYSLSYYVQSRTADMITYLRLKWYPVNKKKIPFDLISKYFDEQSLAWWYMDDGHLKLEGNKPRKIILSTESFNKSENSWLIDFLKEKYNLHFYLDKQNRIILYDQFQIYYFLHLVTPYLHGSMHRKFLKSCEYRFHIPNKRTTIYLPTSIALKYPTKEINGALYELDKLINIYKRGKFYKRNFFLFNENNEMPTKGYQIILESDNLSRLCFMKGVTGLTFSKLAEISFKTTLY